MQSHSDVIEAFGGVRPFAEAIGISHARAIHFPRRGIPSRYWPSVEKAAIPRKIKVTTHDLATLTRDGEPAPKRNRRSAQHVDG